TPRGPPGTSHHTVTTLCRSSRRHAKRHKRSRAPRARGQAEAVAVIHAHIHPLPPRRDTAAFRHGDTHPLDRRQRRHPLVLARRQDRKSTRLNSSHVSISHAV